MRPCRHFNRMLSFELACVVDMSCVVSLSFFKDSNFTWANAGAAVFGAPVAPATKTKGSGAASDDEEVPDNVDIHFEPIVSLPEVPFKI